MDKLPVELLEQILHNAYYQESYEASLAKRTVCRSFRAIITPLLFRRFVTDEFSRKAFDRLASLAQSENLAPLIKEYKFVAESIIKSPPQDAAQILLQVREPSRWELAEFSDSIATESKRFLLQQDVIHHLYDTITIIQCFPLLKNLQVLELSCQEDWEDQWEPLFPKHGTPKRDGLCHPCESIDAITRAFKNFMMVLGSDRHRNSLPHLSSFAFTTTYPLPLMIDLDDYRLIRAFRRFSTVEIESYFNRGDPRLLKLGLLLLISCSHTLRELTIVLTTKWFGSIPPTCMPYISKVVELRNTGVFQNLTKLSLSGLCIVQFDQLLTFLLHHIKPGVLKELELDSLILEGFPGNEASWVDVFHMLAFQFPGDKDLYNPALLRVAKKWENEGKVWKHVLRLEKCQLRRLSEYGPRHDYTGPDWVDDADIRECENWLKGKTPAAPYLGYLR